MAFETIDESRLSQAVGGNLRGVMITLLVVTIILAILGVADGIILFTAADSGLTDTGKMAARVFGGATFPLSFLTLVFMSYVFYKYNNTGSSGPRVEAPASTFSTATGMAETSGMEPVGLL